MYDLHKLGWYGYQQLCLTVLREVLGQTVESYLDTNDAGQDGAFTGTWHRGKNENLSGRFIFQCKHTTKANYRLQLSDLNDEAMKVTKLVKQNRCDCYVLLTNAGLTGQMRNKIETLFKNSGAKDVLILGSTWLCQQIHENKRLRMLVPRVYGLGDLSEILDERAYRQARTLLDSMREDLSKIVITSAYQKAVEAINNHGFVLLIGEPAAGKTTIASLLAMAAIDLWGAFTMKLDDASKILQHWNPENPSQFFWIDDAFGVTQYESFLTQSWNHIIPQIKSMLNQDVKIVMTSRDYIYNRARRDLKQGAFPLFQESQVVIDVHNLKLEEKQQILYNHLKLGKQSKKFLKEIKPQLENIAKHPRFIPETARRLSDPAFTKGVYVFEHTLNEFVNKQEQHLLEVLEGLDSDSKAALALIYMRNDDLESPIKLNDTEEIAIRRLSSSLGGCTTALEAMKDSLVQYIFLDESAKWKFKHPTIGDAFARFLVQNPELLEIYIRGTTVEKLIYQITCGNVKVENAVVVPKGFFPLVMEKLNEFSSSRSFKAKYYALWDARDKLHRFLSYRCSKEFLSFYIEQNKDILDQVSNPGLYLSAVSEVELALTLFKQGLLPEIYRQRIVQKISEYTVKGDDFYIFESKKLKKIFTQTEFTNLLNEVRLKLIPKLSSVRRNWEKNYKGSESIDDYIYPLTESLNAIKEEFQSEQEIIDEIEFELVEIENWVTENIDKEDPHFEREKLGDVNVSNNFNHTRSIFDDIDD